MNRRIATVSVLSAALLLPTALAGCASEAELGPIPSVEGEFGKAPVIQVPRTRPAPTARDAVVIAGNGHTVESGEVVIADVSVTVWQGVKPYLDTYGTKQPTSIVLDGRHVSRTWDKALVGKSAGSRVVLVGPATQGFGPHGQAPANVRPSDTLIVVFDILGSYAPDAAVGPEVSRKTLQASATSAPASRLASRTLIRGNGPTIQAGKKIVVQYKGLALTDGKIFDSSYGRKAPNGFQLSPSTMPPGWFEELTGKQVGSRVLISVPVSAGRGFTSTPGGITAPQDTPIAWIVDILDCV